ncbi:Hypothetical protein LUCI_1665 [Lucifera butyrica]|uniref:Uncharacterized protein n=1 Tax=Lucifera butyrica TaxID=1351585 RepID=A0A498R8C6_9FIRM|nr:hypothetical protein [Lucifera butyrica]VBB06433.1 Hypothetical protein LUCI_1665 [Lucifera butyrica]
MRSDNGAGTRRWKCRAIIAPARQARTAAGAEDEGQTVISRGSLSRRRGCAVHLLVAGPATSRWTAIGSGVDVPVADPRRLLVTGCRPQLAGVTEEWMGAIPTYFFMTKFL